MGLLWYDSYKEGLMKKLKEYAEFGLLIIGVLIFSALILVVLDGGS